MKGKKLWATMLIIGFVVFRIALEITGLLILDTIESLDFTRYTEVDDTSKLLGQIGLAYSPVVTGISAYILLDFTSKLIPPADMMEYGSAYESVEHLKPGITVTLSGMVTLLILPPIHASLLCTVLIWDRFLREKSNQPHIDT